MSTLAEIEAAVKKLPLSQQETLLTLLSNRLRHLGKDSPLGTNAQKERAEVLRRTHGALDEADGLAFEQAMEDARRLKAHG